MRCRPPIRATTNGRSGSSSSSIAPAGRQARAAVNWCPACKTVLANEQVINGFCERHPDVKVEPRMLDQWFFTISQYAQRLLDYLETADWSHSTRTIQANWIGRSDGAELVFETPAGQRITVFTTRPDTVFGATYLVLAPEHALVADLTSAEQRADVNAYRRRCRRWTCLPQGRRQGQDRRLHRLLRAQSSHRRCRAGLDRRLRPDGVRTGRSWRCPATTSATSNSPRR